MHIYLAYQQLLIDSFHNNLLGRILADIETQLQHFVIAFILQKERERKSRVRNLLIYVLCLRHT